MKQKVLLACLLCAAVTTGCSKNESSSESAGAQTRDASGRVAYTSEQQQYIQSLHQDVVIDDPDALLDDLNNTVGDISDHAERVRLNSVEQPAARSMTTLPDTPPPTTE